MRLLGHPVHVMLIHFPVALWPAHWLLHVFHGRLPTGVAAVAGFWLLVAGTALGWLAAFAGAADLLALWRENDTPRVNLALTHGIVNGTAVTGFTVIAALEYGAYPAIVHGTVFLVVEAVLLGLMFIGNYFGGSIVWRDNIH